MTPTPTDPATPGPAPLPARPRWKRILRRVAYLVGGLVALVVVLAAAVVLLWRAGRLQPFLVETVMAGFARKNIPLYERPWPPPGTPPGQVPPDAWKGPRLDLGEARDGAAFYRATNLWLVDVDFTRREWKALQPRHVRSSANFNAPDGKFPLNNTNAQRSGVAGVLGLDFGWSSGSVTLGGQRFTNVGVRFKGNGTYLGSLAGFKRPLKLDLARNVKGREAAGRTVFNLNNLIADWSGLSDTLAYELYRDAGVPASRTAFARVRLGLEGEFQARPFGLYVMPEPIDDAFAHDRWGRRDAALFKPVTYELFADLGKEWAPYARIYDPRVEPSPAQQRRLIGAAQMVTHADDARFAREFGEWFDLDEVARFLAVTVLLSTYDGFLNNGQNFYLYLDPRTDRFGFLPWDLDRAWGEFPFTGTAEQRERASIWRPWVADHRLLERAFRVPAFTNLYRQHLTTAHQRLFTPARLNARIDELAALVRPAIQEEAEFRAGRFEIAISDQWQDGPRDGRADDPYRPVHQLKRFIANRHRSVAAQLAGTEAGHVFATREMPGGPPPSPATNAPPTP